MNTFCVWLHYHVYCPFTTFLASSTDDRNNILTIILFPSWFWVGKWWWFICKKKRRRKRLACSKIGEIVESNGRSELLRPHFAFCAKLCNMYRHQHMLDYSLIWQHKTGARISSFMSAWFTTHLTTMMPSWWRTIKLSSFWICPRHTR